MLEIFKEGKGMAMEFGERLLKVGMFMKVNTKKIKNMEKEYIHGKMGVYTKAILKMTSSMDKEL